MSNIEETDEGITDLPTDTTDFEVTDTETGWDGGEEEEEGEEQVEEEETYIEGPVHYNTEDFISSYYMVDDCTVPENILEFDHSYGYDCKRYFNLVVADENTIIFASGNLIHFLDVTSRKVSFRRSALGGGIGGMVKNPNPEFPHIAIAENGTDPPVIIYEWPTLEIVAILRGGAAACFTNLSYNPDGLLLVTQGGEPDNLITIWNWRKSRIVLRTLSSTNDVFRAIFSPSVPGHLTTCGLAHIKFWKMAKTFTGLKLKGELGRFGKTEYTDILGIYPMPDEKVVSGCDWGNILVWDEGLIKLEVFRKLRKKCHEKAIVQFYYKNGELWTISQDGHIKIWYYDTIDQADPPDEDRVVQMEPSYDFYTPNTELMYIKKRCFSDDDTMYIAQDGNGGIWCIDLNTEDDPLPPVQLLKCHAGPVADIAACPWGSLLCSLGKDGRLYIYNYLLKIMVHSHEFPAGGRCIIWLSMRVDPTGEVMLLAFEDGVVRVAILDISEDAELDLILIQVIKPHRKAITAMSINSDGSLLVTGSEDATIFIFMVSYRPGNFVKLIPIGYVPTPDVVSCLAWHNENDAIIIVGCIHGQIMQVEVPNAPVDYTKITYILKGTPKYQKFATYKAQIRRDIKVAEINAKKKIKSDKKRVEMEKIMKDNPGLDIDEEVFLADSDSEEELEPLYIPPVPNRILWIQHLINSNLWLSMAGYDAGYIYQYHIDQKDDIPLWFKMVKNADDTEISSYLYNHSMKYLILAMQDGSIRVNKCDIDDVTDLTDYWIISMHDNYNGFVPRMCFSFDEKYFFSCGYDGNVFSYRFNVPQDEYIEPYTRRIATEEPPTAINDITDPKYLSLEEAIVKKEEDRKFKVAEDHKTGIRKQLQELRKAYIAVLEKNKRLLKTQIIPREQLEIDDRIADNLRYHLSSHLALVKRKLAFHVEKAELGMIKMKRHFTDPLDMFPIQVTGICRPTVIRTMRQRKLGKEFYDLLELVEEKMIEAEIRGRAPKRGSIVHAPPPPIVIKERPLEYFLLGLSPSTLHHKLGTKLNRLLYKYRQRKVKKERRNQQWDKFNSIRPKEGVNHPEDEAAILEAEATIGNFKLKTAHDYKIPQHLRASTVKKYKSLLLTRLQQYDLRHEFNIKVYEMRNKKVKLRETLKGLQDSLEQIHSEVPENQRKYCVAANVLIRLNTDFPELNLDVIATFPDNVVKDEPPKDVVHGATLELLKKEVLEFRFEANYIMEDLTAWEEEMQNIRGSRKLYEQSLVIEAMDDVVKSFNDELHNLWEERTRVMVDATFIDLHLLALNEELIILKDFESNEDMLSEKVHSIMQDLMDQQDITTALVKQIENTKRVCETLQEEEKSLNQQFLSTMSDYKFFDFLRRIFKKKYKPPKVKKADDSDSDSESSSDSSSDEEEDTGSIDSRDIGILRLDESVCPKNCDQALYDLTFTLRGKRHGIELGIKDALVDIQTQKKDLENSEKKMKLIENNLKKSQEELEAYQRKKQQKLNEVSCTLTLSAHQIQNINSENKSVSINQSLVFSKSTLSRLYKRVGQLQTESILQKSKHKKRIGHLIRMNTDIKHMTCKMEEVKKKIKEIMKIKFGGLKPDFTYIDAMQGIQIEKQKQTPRKQINSGLDEIEECVIKRLVFQLRLSMVDIKSLYEKEMQKWRIKYQIKKEEHIATIRQNTCRLELIGVLKREIRELSKTINHQKTKLVRLVTVSDIANVYKEDLKKLFSIVEEQRKEIDVLRDEIKRMRTKGMQHLEPNTYPNIEEIPDDVSSDWSDYEGYFKKHNLYTEDGRLLPYFDGDKPPPELLESMEKEMHTTDYDSDSSPVAIVKHILCSLLSTLNVMISDGTIEHLIGAVKGKESISDIIVGITDAVDKEMTDEEKSAVEISAQILFKLQEQQLTQQERDEICKEIMTDILKGIDESVHRDFGAMLRELIESLPIQYLMNESSLKSISDEFVAHEPKLMRTDYIEALRDAVSDLPQGLREEVQSFLERILEKVFNTGIDYLYVIKHEDYLEQAQDEEVDVEIEPEFSEYRERKDLFQALKEKIDIEEEIKHIMSDVMTDK